MIKKSYIMKKIYLVLIGIAVTILLNATSPYLTAYYFRQNKQYRDSIDNLPAGNYFTIQPGLYDIANQMPPELGRLRINKDAFDPLGAYPIILNYYIPDNNKNNIDTFKYNWKNDMIVCVNRLDIVGGDDYCELISSMDTLLAIWDDTVKLNRNCNTELKGNRKYLESIKQWNDTVLNSICLPDDGYIHSGYSYSLSRLTIQNGKLIDVRTKWCKHIDSYRLK